MVLFQENNKLTDICNDFKTKTNLYYQNTGVVRFLIDCGAKII